MYLSANLLKEKPLRWSERIDFLSIQWVLTEKYFLQDLQKYLIEEPLLVFLMTERVVKHLGQEYFFHIPHSNTIWYNRSIKS